LIRLLKYWRNVDMTEELALSGCKIIREKPYRIWECKTGFGKVHIHDDFIALWSKDKSKEIIIGTPDPTDAPYELSVYVANHATLLIKGAKKKKVDLLIRSDEYPTSLRIDETERKFLSD